MELEQNSDHDWDVRIRKSCGIIYFYNNLALNTNGPECKIIAAVIITLNTLIVLFKSALPRRIYLKEIGKCIELFRVTKCWCLPLFEISTAPLRQSNTLPPDISLIDKSDNLFVSWESFVWRKVVFVVNSKSCEIFQSPRKGLDISWSYQILKLISVTDMTHLTKYLRWKNGWKRQILHLQSS